MQIKVWLLLLSPCPAFQCLYKLPPLFCWELNGFRNLLYRVWIFGKISPPSSSISDEAVIGCNLLLPGIVFFLTGEGIKLLWGSEGLRLQFSSKIGKRGGGRMCSAGGILPLKRNLKYLQSVLRPQSSLAYSGIGFGWGERFFFPEGRTWLEIFHDLCCCTKRKHWEGLPGWWLSFHPLLISCYCN